MWRRWASVGVEVDSEVGQDLRSDRPESRSGNVGDVGRDTRTTTRRKADLNRRLRLAFVQGAEERSRSEHGRGLTANELRRVLRRYPGDLPEG
jgi:hypothetical protein